MRIKMIAVALLACLGLTAPSFAQQVVMTKSPACGCCDAWAAHLEAEGFEVETVEQNDMAAVKTAAAIPQSLWSCHTARVEGYLIEGHVPARDIRRLLGETPDVRGLAVPGMPVGSPGMEMGSARDAYDVIAFGRDGEQIYSTYEARD